MKYFYVKFIKKLSKKIEKKFKIFKKYVAKEL